MKFLHSLNFELNKDRNAKKTSPLQSICKIPTWLLLAFLFWSPSEGGKVLVIPLDNSHWLSMRLVVERLHQKGHEIVVVAPDVNMRIKPSVHYTLKTFAVPYTEEYMKGMLQNLGRNVFSPQPFLTEMTEMLERTRNFSAFFLDSCKDFLYNKEIIAYLEQDQFDVVFMVPVSPCGQILAEHLSLPSVYYSRGFPCGLEATQCPNPPSYVPRFFTSHSDHMDFRQRVKNFLVSPFEFFFCYFLFSSFNVLSTEFLQREVTVRELYSQGSIWLLRYDFAFEYPRPLMPNMVLIGGINCEKKRPLTEVRSALRVTYMNISVYKK